MFGHSPITPTQRRILQFFQEQPHAVETPKGIAIWLCAELDEVTHALQGLVDRKWLSAHEASAVVGYSLTGNDRFLAEIKQTLEAS